MMNRVTDIKYYWHSFILGVAPQTSILFVLKTRNVKIKMSVEFKNFLLSNKSERSGGFRNQKHNAYSQICYHNQYLHKF